MSKVISIDFLGENRASVVLISEKIATSIKQQISQGSLYVHWEKGGVYNCINMASVRDFVIKEIPDET